MQEFDETTEQGRELRDAYKRAKDTAILHRKAELELTKGAMSMSMQAVMNSKSKIADLAKSLKKFSGDFEKLGGTWDNEIERRKINV